MSVDEFVVRHGLAVVVIAVTVTIVLLALAGLL